MNTKFMKKMKADVVVIGGGAAGMMAAIRAAELGAKTILLERNIHTGEKLRITGKGRCNITNNCTVQEVLNNVPENSRFLYSALNRFSPLDTMEYFTGIGVELKTERGNRVFPVSDKAMDVVYALRAELKKKRVEIVNTRVRHIRLRDGFAGEVASDTVAVDCGAVVLCTGGRSYPRTGSTGDGYDMAAELGHSIVDPRPSLVALLSSDPVCKEMQGLSLKNVALCITGEKSGKIYSDFGEMQFTHFGISGPMVLSASSHIRRYDTDKYTAHIDLKPALDEKKLDLRIQRDFEKYMNKDFSNSLGDLASRMMIPVLVKRSGIPPETKVNSITKAQRRMLVSIFKDFQIPISGTRPIEEAIVTSGGVSVKEINPSTMESKLIKGLFFAGEIIDVDGYTGGFNLQIAWSTGALAGENAAYFALENKI